MMPLDSINYVGGWLTARDRANRRSVALWLFAVCAMVFLMIALGGATRLTGSGLSIMEWAPLRGALPPLSQAEWERLFALYQQIPQYELVNKGFGLVGFKQIFWLEWTHRLWGRLIGLAFLAPGLILWWRGAIPRSLMPRLVLLLILGGLQGAVGWFMVASGFEAESTAVSPYRLVAHLVLALGLYAALLWTALDQWRMDPAFEGAPTWLGRMTALCCAAVWLTLLAGGFVAGLKAGLTYNTFPLMDGRLVPAGYDALQPWWRNLTENIAAVQFNHRLLATATAVLIGSTCLAGMMSRATVQVRRGLAALGFVTLLQYGLGIATLLLVVPVALGTAHQAVAVLVLTASLVALHLQREPR